MRSSREKLRRQANEYEARFISPVDLWRLYLLLVNFAAVRNAEVDGLHISTSYGQMERAAFGLVQIVDV